MPVKVVQLCLTLCNLIDCIVHGILQARILEQVTFPFSRGIFPTQESNRSLLHCRQIDSLPIEPSGKSYVPVTEDKHQLFSCVTVCLSIWLSENTMNCFYLSVYPHFHQLVVMNRKVEKCSTLPGSQALQLQESAMHTGFFPNPC